MTKTNVPLFLPAPTVVLALSKNNHQRYDLQKLGTTKYEVKHHIITLKSDVLHTESEHYYSGSFIRRLDATQKNLRLTETLKPIGLSYDPMGNHDNNVTILEEVKMNPVIFLQVFMLLCFFNNVHCFFLKNNEFISRE